MIYSIIMTMIALVLAIIALKWKIATRTVTYFCMKYFRQTTDKEISDCSKKAISDMLHIKK